MMDEDSPPFVVVASYWHPNDAAAFLSVLASEGIDARLMGDHLSTMRSGLEMFAGGTKVVVPGDDADRAREILREAEPERIAEDEETFDLTELTQARIERCCPRCQGKDITAPYRAAAVGAVVFGLFAAAVSTGLPMPSIYAVFVAAVAMPMAYIMLLQVSGRWRCNDCGAAWKM